MRNTKKAKRKKEKKLLKTFRSNEVLVTVQKGISYNTNEVLLPIKKLG